MTKRTPKQIEASRTNGRSSKGPVTIEGKVKSSRNSLKHGILSKDIVLQGELYGEDPAEFEELLTGLQEHWAPVGTQEGLLVEDIASCYWRKKRILRAEQGKISSRLQLQAWKVALHQVDDSKEQDEFTSLRKVKLRLDEIAVRIENDCISLRKIKAFLEAGNKLDSDQIATIKSITRCLSLADEALIVEMVMPEYYSRRDGDVSIEKSDEPECLLREITAHIKLTQEFKQLMIKGSRDLSESAMKGASTLSPELNLALVRYQAGLDKQLYRAVAMLKMIQDTRASQRLVPPDSNGDSSLPELASTALVDKAKQ